MATTSTPKAPAAPAPAATKRGIGEFLLDQRAFEFAKIVEHQLSEYRDRYQVTRPFDCEHGLPP